MKFLLAAVLICAAPFVKAQTHDAGLMSPAEYARSVRTLAFSYIDAAHKKNLGRRFAIMGVALKFAPMGNADEENCDQGTLAYTVPGIKLNFCNHYTDLDRNQAAQTLIHEMAHYLGVLGECDADRFAQVAARAAGAEIFYSGYAYECSRKSAPEEPEPPRRNPLNGDY